MHCAVKEVVESSRDTKLLQDAVDADGVVYLTEEKLHHFFSWQCVSLSMTLHKTAIFPPPT